jgi:hypothetical protein
MVLKLHFWCIHTSLTAQNLIGNSTLSRYGMGIAMYDGYSRNMGMGNTGAGQFSSDHLNLTNPALLANNRLVNFEFAGFFEGKLLDNPNLTGQYGNLAGGPAYLTIAFPTSKRSTTAFGIRPAYSTNFQIKDQNLIAVGPDSFQSNFKGSGSISRAFLAHSRNIYKGLNAGIEANFWLGNLEQNTLLAPASAGQSVGFQRDIRYSVKSFSFNPGLSWQGRANKEKETYYCIGLTGNVTNRLNFSTTDVIYTRLASGLNVKSLYPDTLSDNTSRHIYLAQSVKLGFSYFTPNKFTLAFDAALLRANGNAGLMYASEGTIGRELNFGAEYTPGTAKSAKYVNIIRYRAGFSHRVEPFKTALGEQLFDNRLSLGFSLPVVRSEAKFTRPLINFALMAGIRGTSNKGPNRELYTGAVVGFTLNDSMWFRRYRVD